MRSAPLTEPVHLAQARFPGQQTATPAESSLVGEGEGGEFVVERRLRHEEMAHRIASGILRHSRFASMAA